MLKLLYELWDNFIIIFSLSCLSDFSFSRKILRTGSYTGVPSKLDSNPEKNHNLTFSFQSFSLYTWFRHSSSLYLFLRIQLPPPFSFPFRSFLFTHIHNICQRGFSVNEVTVVVKKREKERKIRLINVQTQTKMGNRISNCLLFDWLLTFSFSRKKKTFIGRNYLFIHLRQFAWLFGRIVSLNAF